MVNIVELRYNTYLIMGEIVNSIKILTFYKNMIVYSISKQGGSLNERK